MITITNHFNNLIPPNINKNVKIINTTSVVAIFLLVLNFVINFTEINNIFQLKNGLLLLFFSTLLIINKLSFHQISKYLLCFLPTIFVVLLNLKYGIIIDALSFYLILAMLNFYLFKNKVIKIYALTPVIAAFLINKISSLYNSNVFQIENNWCYIIFSTLIIALLSNAFYLNYKKALLSSKLKNKELKLLNDKYKIVINNYKTANSKLDNKNIELERFAYIASHDLKSPVRNILSFTNLLNKKIEEKDFKSIKMFVGIINLSAEKMNELIDSILQFSKVQKMDKEKLKTLNLNKILDKTKIAVLKDFPNKPAKIVVEKLPTFIGDETQINQVFKNLLENGIKYNENETPTINIFAESQKDSIILKFADNGIGMEKLYYNKVFEMFKRLHSQNEYTGTGIGLAICKKIVENHNGKIFVNSNKSGGSCFQIQFPKSSFIFR